MIDKDTEARALLHSVTSVIKFWALIQDAPTEELRTAATIIIAQMLLDVGPERAINLIKMADVMTGQQTDLSWIPGMTLVSQQDKEKENAVN